MLVTTLDHGRRVFSRLSRVPWIALDTETKAKHGYSGKDALVYDRAEMLVFSMCHRGESYCFPTSLVSPEFPTAAEWAQLLNSFAKNRQMVKCGHNFKYDLHIFFLNGSPVFRNIWDTMIGCWMANAGTEKGLKSRAPLYGRHLRETKTVNFDDLDELAEYAEQDVIQTDEIYQMQRFGFVQRPRTVHLLGANGKLHPRSTFLPYGKHVIRRESLGLFEKHFLQLQELPILRATARAERCGFPLNRPRVHAIRAKLAQDKKDCLKRIYSTAGRKFNFNSPKQVVALLHELGVETPFKTKSGAASVGSKALFKMQKAHPIIGELMNLRKLEKLESVYIGSPDSDGEEGLEYYVNRDTGRIHCTMNTVGAVTGRFSAQLPNLTQIPSRADTYGIKDCFVPPKGKLLICLDYAQLEIRIMAIFCKDENMTKILCDPNGDIHTITAEHFKVARNPTAKNLNFLLLYGGQEYMLAENLTVVGVPTEPDEARAFIDGYNNHLYPRVHQFRLELLAQHRRYGYVEYLTGRKRTLDDIDWNNKWSVHKAETTLSNNTIQASGQDMLKASIVRCNTNCINPDASIQVVRNLSRLHAAYVRDCARKISKLRREFRLARLDWALQVHDEAVYFADKSAAVDMAHRIAEVMTWKHYFPSITDYSVPLVVEGGVGESWAHAKGKSPIAHVKAGI